MLPLIYSACLQRHLVYVSGQITHFSGLRLRLRSRFL